MSNNGRDFFDDFDDIEAIFRKRDETIAAQVAVTNAQNKRLYENKVFFAAQEAVEKQTSDIGRNDPSRGPKHIKAKTIGPFKRLKREAKKLLEDAASDIINSSKNITVETLVSIALVLGLISGTIAMTFPNIKCNKFRNKLKEEIEARSYESYSASQIVEELGIDRDDYFRIYLLSHGMSSDMYYKILNELGYSDLSTIARKEGYKNTEYERATELLTKDYETKLQQIIDKMHDEPEQTVSYYCNLYPELIPYVLSEHDLALYLCGPEKGLIK